MKSTVLCVSLVLLLMLFITDESSGQIVNHTISLTPIGKQQPADCTQTQFFDIVELACRDCPLNSFTTTNDKFNCKCAQTHFSNFDNGGGSIECRECAAGEVQSLDGFVCIRPTPTADCAVNANNERYPTDTNEDGSTVATRRCVACNLATSLSVGDACRSCKPYVFLETETIDVSTLNCQDKYNTPLGGVYFQQATVEGQPNYFRCPFDTSTGVSDCTDSAYSATYAPAAYRMCRVASRRNRTACHQLGNLCALNLFSYLSGSTLGRVDVCQAYDRLYADNNQLLPWLRYPEDYGDYKERYLEQGIGGQFLKIKFSSTCVLSPQLKFFAAEYLPSGHLTRFSRFDISRLQLCNLVSNLARTGDQSPLTTTHLEQSCSLSLSSLFELADSNSGQLFYELFFEYDFGATTGNLLRMPVKLLDYRSIETGAFVNRAPNENTHQHLRRFFLLDTLSTRADLNSQSSHIRYAKSIKITVDLISGKSDGEIYPPVISIEYATARRDQLANNPNLKVPVSFRIDYRMDTESYLLVVYISAGVLIFLAIMLSCLRIWNWNKRSGRYGCDQVTLFKFLMSVCGYVANTLFFLVVLATLYWLIVYRGQTVAFIFLPLTNQENIFTGLISLAFGLKLFEIIYLILLQTSYDIFFIDWERPSTSSESTGGDSALLETGARSMPPLPPINRPKPTMGGPNVALDIDEETRHELRTQNRVSCWRTLFVANEWNELQTLRQTNTVVRLAFLLLLLNVINLEELTVRDCSQELFKDANEYSAPASRVMRVALASSLLVAIWLVQWIAYTVFYSRLIEDKIGQFVDFCSISNISVFVLTHTQYGYYIHGRSPHGNADTSMQRMTEALVREANDMTCKRGLENGSDHQTFSISVPVKLTRQYHKVMRPLYDRNIRSGIRRDGSSSEFEKRMLAYTRLNRFLMLFINNALRDINYQIVSRNFFENLLNMEFKLPLEHCYFYKDDLNCFTDALFYGKERSLFIFETLLFLFVDYFAQSFVLAAIIVYLVSTFLSIIRGDLGKRNISKKTLVDKRFLI